MKLSAHSASLPRRRPPRVHDHGVEIELHGSTTCKTVNLELEKCMEIPRWNWNMSKCVGSFQYQFKYFKCCPYKYCSSKRRMEVAITTSMATLEKLETSPCISPFLVRYLRYLLDGTLPYVIMESGFGTQASSWCWADTLQQNRLEKCLGSYCLPTNQRMCKPKIFRCSQRFTLSIGFVGHFLEPVERTISESDVAG